MSDKYSMSDAVVIAGTEKDIWAINPKTKKKIQIKRASDGIRLVDLDASSSGIYHASRELQIEPRLAPADPPLHKGGRGHKKVLKPLAANKVVVYESFSGNPFRTIRPENPEFFPPEDAGKYPVRFRFLRGDGFMGYMLDDSGGIIFPEFRGEVPVWAHYAGSTGRDVYFIGRQIATLPDDVVYSCALHMKDLEHTARMKNKKLYAAHKGFFER